MKTCYSLGAPWGDWALSAFLSGVQAADPWIQVVELSDQAELPSGDLGESFAVCFGLWPPREEKVTQLLYRGVETVVLDSGYINRPPYNISREEYVKGSHSYALNFNGILRPEETTSRLGFDERARMLRSAEWSHLRLPEKEGFERNWPRRRGYVLLGQTADDRSHRLTLPELSAAYRHFATFMSGRADVFYRAHPQGPSEMESLRDVPGCSALDSAEPLLAQLEKLLDTHELTVFSISSNAGFEALLAGFRVVSPLAWYAGLRADEALRSVVCAQFTLRELASAEIGRLVLQALRARALERLLNPPKVCA